MSKDMGGVSGSREPSLQAISALTGFDPGRVANELEEKARNVREIDAGSDEYRHYWRGYATALDSAAAMIRGRTSQGANQ